MTRQRSLVRRAGTTTASLALATLASIALLFAGPAAAQDGGGPGASGSGSGSRSGAGPAASERPPAREQSIYIPYKKLRDVFEREGRGVFLPYEEFQALWRAAREATDPGQPEPAPADALITETSNEATVQRDVVAVSATISIELLKDGWNEVPLRLDDAAITRATIDGGPARLAFAPGAGYRLLYEKPAGAPLTLELELEYAKSYHRAPGRNSVSFNAPQAPISRWRVAIPEPGVKVNLQPLIAATDVPTDSEGALPEGATGDGWSVVLAFVGPAPSVGIDWTPRSEGATGLTALADVSTEQQVWIDEGVVRTRTDLVYEISRDALSRLTIEVPGNEKVVDVSDANIRQWSVEDVAGGGADGDEDDEAAGAPRQRITIDLFEPIRGRQTVRVDLERFTGNEGGTLELTTPLVRAVEAARQGGIVVVKTGPELSPQVRRAVGLLQIDAGELSPALAKSPWDFSYRYTSVPFVLAIEIEKITPFITAEGLVSAFLTPEALEIDHVVVYDVQRAGVFELLLDVPPGYDVRRVRGRTVGDALPVEVDAHHLGDPGEGAEEGAADGAGRRRLTVSLSRKAMGKVALGLTLFRNLDHPELITPSDASAELVLLVPRVAGEEVRRETGRVVLYAPESLRVTPKEVMGLRSVPPAEAIAGMAPQTETVARGARPMLAYEYAQDAASLTVAAQRRRPYVTVGQLLAATVEPGLVKFDATFFLDVKYSGVRSLRIDVPADVSPDLRNTTTGVRDEILAPQPDDVAAGAVAWRLTGEREFLGRTTITLAWQRELEDLGVGKSVELAVPRLVPAGVDRAWGQVVILKSETVDVHESGAPTGVRPIDPQHDLMPPASFPTAARAFEFQDEWSLSITATHYELEEVKRTSIERALLRMVRTRSDQVTVQALYRMRSARQRLAVTLPADAEFDSQPLRLNGAAAPLERGNPGEYFIPLSGTGAEEAFLLELRYVRTDPAAPFEAPAFPDEPAIQMAYCSVFLPQAQALLGAPGAWTQEMFWREDGWLDRSPVPRRSERDLIAWVTEGVNVAGDPVGGLQADGRRYLFSTLRPVGPEATLTLRTMSRTLLSALVFLIVAGIGVGLLRAGAGRRIVAVGCFVTALILAGVFAPTFSLQIMDGVLLAAVVIVLLLWTAHYFAFVRPHDPLVAARRNARIAAAQARAQASMVILESSPVPPPAPPPPAGAGEGKGKGDADGPGTSAGGKTDA